MTIADIDFAALYRAHMASAGRPKLAQAWDARADDMNKGGPPSPYVRDFLGRMDFSGCSSLLDVGCGTGAIALAAAPLLREVIGLDFSPRMLELLQANAAAGGFAHVRTIRRAWDDDWRDVPRCDIVVASRSTVVTDMADALDKLTGKAKKRVYLTSRVGGRFIDPAVFAAIGRPVPPPLPDYIYIINLLHARGIHPRLDYIDGDPRGQGMTDFAGFARRVGRAVGELSIAESARLERWYATDAGRACDGDPLFKWAFISWETA